MRPPRPSPSMEIVQCERACPILTPQAPVVDTYETYIHAVQTALCLFLSTSSEALLSKVANARSFLSTCIDTFAWKRWALSAVELALLHGDAHGQTSTVRALFPRCFPASRWTGWFEPDVERFTQMLGCPEEVLRMCES